MTKSTALSVVKRGIRYWQKNLCNKLNIIALNLLMSNIFCTFIVKNQRVTFNYDKAKNHHKTHFWRKDTLNSVISKGTSRARTISRAHILLKSNAEGDKQYTIDELTDLLNTSKHTVCRVLKDYKVSGIECIYRKTRKTPPPFRRVVQSLLRINSCIISPEVVFRVFTLCKTAHLGK